VICDPFFLWKTTIYTYKITRKSLIPQSTLLPFGQPLVSHVSVEETDATWIQIPPALLVIAWLRRTCVLGFNLSNSGTFRPLHSLCPNLVEILKFKRKDFDSCKDNSQPMLTALNELVEIPG